MGMQHTPFALYTTVIRQTHLLDACMLSCNFQALVRVSAIRRVQDGENDREREGGEEGLGQEEMLSHVDLVCVWLSSEPQKSEPDNILPNPPVLFPCRSHESQGSPSATHTLTDTTSCFYIL